MIVRPTTVCFQKLRLCRQQPCVPILAVAGNLLSSCSHDSGHSRYLVDGIKGLSFGVAHFIECVFGVHPLCDVYQNLIPYYMTECY